MKDREILDRIEALLENEKNWGGNWTNKRIVKRLNELMEKRDQKHEGEKK